MITAPRQFGKSANLKTIKNFLSVPVNDDETTQILSTFRHLKINTLYPDHTSFTEHLTRSFNLDASQKNVVERWCGGESCLKMKPMDVKNCLGNLAKCLYICYNNTKVFC